MPDLVAATLDAGVPDPGAPAGVPDPGAPAAGARDPAAGRPGTPGVRRPDAGISGAGVPAAAGAEEPPAPGRPAPGVIRWSRRVLAGATPVVAAAALGQVALLGRDIILLRWPTGTHPWSPDLFVSPLPLAALCVPALLAMVAAVLSGTAEHVWSRSRGGAVLAMVLLAGPLEFRAAGLIPVGWPGGDGFPLDERQWAWQAACAVAVAALALASGRLGRRATPIR